MNKLSKYSKTFGAIFGAALIVSGANSLLASHTSARSLATYSFTHELAERLIGSAQSVRMTATEQDAGIAAKAGGYTLVAAKSTPKAGS